MTETIKMRSGDYYVPVTVDYIDNRLRFYWAYSKHYFPLMAEIKAMEGRQWHPDAKCWSVPLTQRNQIALQFLIQGQPNPFEHYSKPLIHHPSEFSLWPHQQEMLDFMLTRHSCLVAADTGTGKTLALLAAIKEIGADPKDIFYVTTKSGIQSFIEELRKWNIETAPTLMTFERLARIVETWELDRKLPYILVGDESHKLKNKDSQRSKAFRHLADSIKQTYKDGYILLASGTPAPNNPVDYWNQCEICAPGYLKESNPKSLLHSLAFMELKETPHGEAWDIGKIEKDGKLENNWRDDPKKCKDCGQYKRTPCPRPQGCFYAPSINEIERLHKRMEGLVLVIDKKKVLDYLPDKVYRVYTCEPTKEQEDFISVILETSQNNMEAFTRLRALSDGFQYYEKEVGERICPACNGVKFGKNFTKIEDGEDWTGQYHEYKEDISECYMCSGTGKVPNFVRDYVGIETNKLKALDELLETYDNRVIVYASFHASLDMLEKHLLEKTWTVFKVDGRGWYGITPSGDKINKSDMLRLFQGKEMEKVCWLGHPSSSGTGITLTASNAIVYYSNSFKADDRQQSENRIHRIGMDTNKGANIYDLCCLESDHIIRESLIGKERLQDMSLGKLREKLNDKRTS